MKLKPTLAFVFLAMLAFGVLTSSMALAQKKKKAPAQEKSRVKVFTSRDGRLLEVDTLVHVSPEQMATHTRLAEVLKQNPQAYERLLVRPSTAGTVAFEKGSKVQTFTRIEAGKEMMTRVLAAEDSTKERTVKLKIVKKENDLYYALDTTLVIPAGVSTKTAIKNLTPEGQSLKALGAKPIQATAIAGNALFGKAGVIQLNGKDSLRNFTIRMVSSDSLSQKTNRQIDKKWKVRVDENGLAKKGHTFYLSKSSNGDSLLHDHLLVKADSLLQLKGDSIFRNKTFTIVKDSANKVNVFRIRTQENGGVDKRFNVHSPKEGEKYEIIVLRATKQAGDKKEAKASKKKEAKTGEVLDVSLYPNPTSGRFTVAFQIDKKSDTRLRVVDSTGKTVLEENAGMQKGLFSRELDLSKFGRGVYILQIISGKNVRSERIVVQ